MTEQRIIEHGSAKDFKRCALHYAQDLPVVGGEYIRRHPHANDYTVKLTVTDISPNKWNVSFLEILYVHAPPLLGGVPFLMPYGDWLLSMDKGHIKRVW